MTADTIHISPSGAISLHIGGTIRDCDVESVWYRHDWRRIAARAAEAAGYRLAGPWADQEGPGGYFGVYAAIEPAVTT